MRDTPKLLLAALTTLICALAGFVAGPAAAAQQSAHAGHGKPHARGASGAGQRAARRQARAQPARRPPPDARQRSARPASVPTPGGAQNSTSQTHVAPRRGRRARDARHRRRAEPRLAARRTIAAVLATPCQNTELTPTGETSQRVRAAVLCLINRVRAENGEAPLSTNADLEAAAEGHATELVADDYFAHVSPSGVTPVERIRATGYIPGPPSAT